jgi:hypothetical protein
MYVGESPMQRNRHSLSIQRWILAAIGCICAYRFGLVTTTPETRVRIGN